MDVDGVNFELCMLSEDLSKQHRKRTVDLVVAHPWATRRMLSMLWIAAKALTKAR